MPLNNVPLLFLYRLPRTYIPFTGLLSFVLFQAMDLSAAVGFPFAWLTKVINFNFRHYLSLLFPTSFFLYNTRCSEMIKYIFCVNKFIQRDDQSGFTNTWHVVLFAYSNILCLHIYIGFNYHKLSCRTLETVNKSVEGKLKERMVNLRLLTYVDLVHFVPWGTSGDYSLYPSFTFYCLLVFHVPRSYKFC